MHSEHKLQLPPAKETELQANNIKMVLFVGNKEYFLIVDVYGAVSLEPINRANAQHLALLESKKKNLPDASICRLLFAQNMPVTIAYAQEGAIEAHLTRSYSQSRKTAAITLHTEVSNSKNTILLNETEIKQLLFGSTEQTIDMAPSDNIHCVILEPAGVAEPIFCLTIASDADPESNILVVFTPKMLPTGGGVDIGSSAVGKNFFDQLGEAFMRESDSQTMQHFGPMIEWALAQQPPRIIVTHSGKTLEPTHHNYALAVAFHKARVALAAVEERTGWLNRMFPFADEYQRTVVEKKKPGIFRRFMRPKTLTLKFEELIGHIVVEPEPAIIHLNSSAQGQKDQLPPSPKQTSMAPQETRAPEPPRPTTYFTGRPRSKQPIRDPRSQLPRNTQDPSRPTWPPIRDPSPPEETQHQKFMRLAQETIQEFSQPTKPPQRERSHSQLSRQELRVLEQEQQERMAILRTVMIRNQGDVVRLYNRERVTSELKTMTTVSARLLEKMPVSRLLEEITTLTYEAYNSILGFNRTIASTDEYRRANPLALGNLKLDIPPDVQILGMVGEEAWQSLGLQSAIMQDRQRLSFDFLPLTSRLLKFYDLAVLPLKKEKSSMFLNLTKGELESIPTNAMSTAESAQALQTLKSTPLYRESGRDEKIIRKAELMFFALLFNTFLLLLLQQEKNTAAVNAFIATFFTGS